MRELVLRQRSDLDQEIGHDRTLVTFVDMAKVDSPIIQKSLAALQALDPTLQILIVKMAQQSSLHHFFNVTNTSYLFYDHGTLMKKLLIEEPTIQDLMTFVGHSLECGFG